MNGQGMTAILPYRIDVPDHILCNIEEKVRTYRWHEMPDGPGLADSWAFGVNQNYLQRLCRYWTDSYDWRTAEVRLNRFNQFTTTIDDIEVHFYMELGSGPSPRPLILIHGWPGSVFEFQELIEPLAHPERFGGDVRDAFTVIVPSLPGYGFSGKPKAPIAPRQVAGMFDQLMTEVLGFERYIAQGGDWGGIICSWLGYEGQGCEAVHLNLMGWQSPGVTAETEEERTYFARIAELRARESGYSELQRTKPQTLSFAMMDSPVGACAWIVEKFHGWSDTREGFENVYSFDQLLTNVMIYLVTESFHTATWLYYGRAQEAKLKPEVPLGARIERPVAVANFPYEFVPFPPRSFVERNVNVAQWTDMDRGGHFAALECGDLLVEDVRRFARGLR
jgi:pimeloyl-ACP methyl ester carboxylesterase